MSRSSFKAPYSSPTNLRSTFILPLHVGKVIKIYNGKTWTSLKIKEPMVGTKFGTYHQTRQSHGKKN